MSLSDAALAAHLAETAGRILIDVRESGVFSAKALVTLTVSLLSTFTSMT